MKQEQIRLSVPKKIDARIRALGERLGLDMARATFLKQRKESRFTPEPDNCQINNLVKTRFDGGTIAYGWVVGQDKIRDIVQAHFFSVWRGDGDELVDITPRPTGEKRLLFIPDPNRKMGYTSYAGRPALLTYDVVRMVRGELVDGVREKVHIPYSELIYEYGFARRVEPA